MEPQPDGMVVIKEGSPPIGVTHIETLRAAQPKTIESFRESRGGDPFQGNTPVEDDALDEVLVLATTFAAYLHRNSHPMFLHALRVMLEYQMSACAGCQAGTMAIQTMFSVSPPTEEALLAVIGRDSWDGMVDPDSVKDRLLAMLKDVEAGTSIDEAMRKIGGRVLATDADLLKAVEGMTMGDAEHS